MASPVDSFSKALVAAGLLTAEELMALWSEIPAEKRPQRPADFANLLVERGKLTKYQAQELVAGRGARLVMGDYVILREIGAGGMGQVYQAQHRRMKRLVALKVMSSAAMRDEAAVKRFQREVQAAARLEHENIVTAYASGESGDVKYLVMQFVDGGDLSQLVKRDGPLPIDRAVDYVLQAATGLAYAHREGVIHRDIKPANLLLDKKGIIKILDMGLARIEDGDDGLTATEQVMGTVDYMSPEQASNTKSADARADIYSLGCTLWYLLTGKKAYEADTMIGRLMAHRDAPLPSLVKTRDDAPWPLEQALHKMLAKRAQDRFQTMDDVIAALAPYGGGGSNSSLGNRSGGSKAGGTRSGGQGSGTRSAEMAAFMQSMSPGAAAAATAKSSSGSKTSLAANLDATQQFDHSEADTDPKSAIRNSSAAAGSSSRVSLPRASSPPDRAPPASKRFVAAGIGGAAVVAAIGIWFLTRGSGDAAIPATNEAIAPSLTSVGRAVAGGTPAIASVPASPQPAASGAPAAAEGNALLFDATSVGIPIPRITFDGSAPLTIEAWTQPRGDISYPLNTQPKPRRLIYHPLLSINFNQRGAWVLQTRTEEDQVAESEAAPHGASPGLSHVAATFVGGRLKLFVDGRLRLIEPSGTIKKSGPNDAFVIGDGPESGAQHYLGIIAEVRISRIARYESDFQPERRLTTDSNTLALYHFDEGTGNFIFDASSGQRNLLLSDNAFGVKPKWTKSPAIRLAPPTAGISPTVLDPIDGEFGGHRYRFVRSKVNWPRAKTEAERLGGHLVSITSQAESDWVKGTLLKTLPMHHLAWIGANRPTTSDAWTWANGEPWSFTNWHEGEGGNGTAAAVARSDVKGIGWGDWNFGTPKALNGPNIGRTRATGYVVEWDTPSK